MCVSDRHLTFGFDPSVDSHFQIASGFRLHCTPALTSDTDLVKACPSIRSLSYWFVFDCSEAENTALASMVCFLLQ